MTTEELKALLEGISGFSDKVVYYAWPEDEAPALPFICFYTPNANNFGADNKVLFSATHYMIELYTEFKDPVSEALIESALADVFYTKSETYISDEKCHEIVYEIEV